MNDQICKKATVQMMAETCTHFSLKAVERVDQCVADGPLVTPEPPATDN